MVGDSAQSGVPLSAIRSLLITLRRLLSVLHPINNINVRKVGSGGYSLGVVRVVNIVDQRGEECSPRMLPAECKTDINVPKIDTGGERRVCNPKVKQA